MSVFTPAALAQEWGVSERRVRSMARRIGACRIFGKTMFFLPEDIEKLAALSTPKNAAGLAESEKEIREARPVAAKQARGYVYFIAGEDRIKIGYAKNVKRRLNALQTSCPFPLTLVAAYPGTVKKERELHSRFASAHLIGEWFRFDGELREFVEGLK